MFFRRKQKMAIPIDKPTRVSLVEYLDHGSGVNHWDVKVTRGNWMAYSITDDYGFKDRDAAVAAYTRQLAIERGEIKVGLSRFTVEEVEIP